MSEVPPVPKHSGGESVPRILRGPTDLSVASDPSDPSNPSVSTSPKYFKCPKSDPTHR